MTWHGRTSRDAVADLVAGEALRAPSRSAGGVHARRARRTRVVGLVGTNERGKTTLLHLAVGLLEPSEGSILVFDAPPGRTSEQLACVGFLAQNAPVYASFSVAEHLRLGDRLNPRWDAGFAEARIGGPRYRPQRVWVGCQAVSVRSLR